MTVGPYYEQDSMYWQSDMDLLKSFEDDRGVMLPKKKIVCPECNGEGEKVNRAIDGQGLSPDDPDLDPEFWEEYHRGTYNVVCDECKGRNVIDVVDEEACGSDPAKMALLREWNQWQQDAHDSVQENLQEMRMGA